MGLGMRVRAAASSGLKSASSQSYEDIEGITISLGVIFALLLPAAMALQYVTHDEKVQERNFFLLLCTQKDFRSFVVETMEDGNTGDVGVYGHEMFNFTVALGRGNYIDTKQVLMDDSMWTARKDPEALYECANKKEAVATSELLVEDFPMRRMNAWALMNPEVALWSDHLHAMCSFSFCILKAGLLGSLLMYISLSASSGRQGEGGEDKEASSKALEAWAKVGVPAMALNWACLMAAVICLLFAQDGYVESQDPFAFRSGRFGNYSKIALLAAFVPLVLAFTAGAVWSLVRSCKSKTTQSQTQVQPALP